MLRLLVGLALVIATVNAVAGPPGARVVLVDPDPELLRAMTTALRPWKLEVIFDATPIDEASAAARADALSARFVVWREGNDLVVFDREQGDVQRREAPAGDAVAAASAALTVKTLMRLPPPEDEAKPPRAPDEAGTEIRVQAGLATRVAYGSEAAVGGRLVGAALVRPVSDLGWRFGVMGEIGTRDRIKQSGFDGDWSDWELLVVASWTRQRGTLELEPFVAAGVARSTFRGDDQMGGPRDERETLPAVRAGLWARWRFGQQWTVGGGLSLDVLPGTPTYTKANNGPVIYEVPGFGITLGVVVAVDLGR